MGIDENLHRRGSGTPKLSAMSSGRSSKSGAIQICPAITPGIRGTEGNPRYATSFATGLPASARITSSPSCTCSTKDESSALAWAILRTTTAPLYRRLTSPDPHLGSNDRIRPPEWAAAGATLTSSSAKSMPASSSAISYCYRRRSPPRGGPSPRRGGPSRRGPPSRRGGPLSRRGGPPLLRRGSGTYGGSGRLAMPAG